MNDRTLFDLIDRTYNEDLSNQPKKYKETLLVCAKMIIDGEDELTVCAHLYKSYHDNYMVPMSFPKESRVLYKYVYDKLNKIDQKRLCDLNIGYGLIATHITFDPFN